MVIFIGWIMKQEDKTMKKTEKAPFRMI